RDSGRSGCTHHRDPRARRRFRLGRMSAQLPLALRWPAQQRFDSYVAGENGAGVDAVRHAAEAGGAWAYLHGPAGCGKTHLLIAACAAAAAAGRSAQYLPLAKLGAGAGDVLRGVGGSELLAIDDLAAAGRDVEHALFDLYNRCKVEKSTLLFAAAAAPAQLGLGLPDLVSRLSACTQLALKPLDEATRRGARPRARRRRARLAVRAQPARSRQPDRARGAPGPRVARGQAAHHRAVPAQGARTRRLNAAVCATRWRIRRHAAEQETTRSRPPRRHPG